MRKVYVTKTGKHVTEAMAATLWAIAEEPFALKDMSDAERNRFHALRDKGLVTLRHGRTYVTGNGHDMLFKIRVAKERALSPQKESGN
jgi:hypothetical protein